MSGRDWLVLVIAVVVFFWLAIRIMSHSDAEIRLLTVTNPCGVAQWKQTNQRLLVVSVGLVIYLLWKHLS